MTELTKAYLAARESGMSYREIAEMFGVSFQRVAQVCGKYNPHRFQFITETGCIYPNWRKWMNDNKVSRYELVRRMGLITSQTEFVNRMSDYMRGVSEPKKWFIDKLLEATGMTYEVLFYKGEEEE